MATQEFTGALSSVDHGDTAPLPSAATPGDVYVAAARAEHLARCADCRTIAEERAAFVVENGESMARRDRRQLDLRIAYPRAVAA